MVLYFILSELYNNLIVLLLQIRMFKHYQSFIRRIAYRQFCAESFFFLWDKTIILVFWSKGFQISMYYLILNFNEEIVYKSPINSGP